MGNGAKAASKRDRKDKDVKVAKSQLKSNEQAKDIQCQVCRSTFLKTTRAPASFTDIELDVLASQNTPRTSIIRH
ncbi:hypothetical protein GcM3_170010 [Golovinomyces cichoracearum]|uniref:Uncharacterized protein n=1 Tax=Golovinomyces cichoracearum TaxID=62708 RepID=A0A420HR54_9PEZI|nr:hypothetical protein GcM3_170010 [Golovinomyces cichoracearum]